MFKPGERLQKLLTLLVAWVILLALFLSYEAYFVKGQRKFLGERGVRVLSALSNELNARFEQAILSTESYLKLVALMQLDEGNTAGQFVPNETRSMFEKLTECRNDALTHSCSYLDIYLKDIWVGDAAFDGGVCPQNNENYIPIYSKLDNDQLTLRLFCSKQDQKKLDATTRIITLNLAPWIHDAFQQLGGYFDDVVVADETGRVLFQQSEIGPAISDLRALAPPSGSTKNQTSSSGTEQASPTNSVTNDEQNAWVRNLRQTTTYATVTLDGESYDLFSQPVHISGSYPIGGGAIIPLVICGLRHADSFESEVHSLPYSALIWAALIATTLFSLSWPVFKLRYMSNTERFRPRDGWFLILAVFLASSSMMFILLNLSYSTQAKRETDSKLHQLANRINSHVTEELGKAYHQLREFNSDPEFANRVHKQTSTYLVPNFFGGNQTDSQDLAPCYPYFEIAFWADAKGAQLLKYDVRSVMTPATDVSKLSFFRDSIADREWLGNNFLPEEHLPDSFSAAVRPSCQAVPSRESFAGLHLEPQFSPNTREFLVILASGYPTYKGEDGTAARGGDSKIAVRALAIKPLSLVDPVMPPGYAFAVIDRECNVLFHSDSIRNLRENFCLESKDKSELEPWLFSGLENPLNITYAGRSERAYFTSSPLPGLSSGKSFLIVYQEPEENPSLNLSIILVCSILLLAYFLFPLVVACLHLSLRNPLRLMYVPMLVWPAKENARGYAQLFSANGLMFVSYWFSYRWLYEAPMLLLTIAVAILAVVFVILRLEFSTRVLFRFGKGLTLVSLSAFAAILIWTAVAKFEFGLLPEWAVVFALLAFFGQIAVVLSGEPSCIQSILARGLRALARMQDFLSSQSSILKRLFSWAGRASRSVVAIAENRYGLAYALAAVTVITCTALVPSVGFFKYAYDAVTEISLKRDQIVFSDSLLARRNRIRQYFETVAVHVPKIASMRINELRDRYDRDDRHGGNDRYDKGEYVDFFATTNEPTLPQSPPPSIEESTQKLLGCDTNSRQEAYLTASSSAPEPINDWIEKWMAGATLKFPQNRIGREMSELGVASTSDDANSSAEHFWTELAPRCFRLSWKGNSSIPNLTVTSSYPKWEGLQPLAGLLLIAFWLVLVIWLLSVVKNIFFTDFEKPPDLKLVNWTSAKDIDTHFLVLGPVKSGKTDRLKDIRDLPKEDWRDLRIELTRVIDNAKYEGPRCQGNALILDHFEFNMTDPAYNRVRLQLLENLLYESTCTLVVVSTVDPLYFLTEGVPQILTDGKNADEAHRMLDRWARVLSRLTKARFAETSGSELENKILELADNSGGPSLLGSWIKEECSCTAFLRSVGLDLADSLRGRKGVTRGSVVEAVLDRATSYYHVIWSSLAASERLVLFQLALDGWTNPKNAAAIQQLEKKVLIFKAPMYRIVNQSFAEFVKSAEHADEIALWEKSERQSTWRALRFFLVVLGVGLAVWLLYAQLQLFQVGTAYIAAIGTLLTAVAGLLGRSKHSVAADSASTPNS